MYSVDQLNIDLCPLDEPHFAAVKKYAFQPAHFNSIMTKISQDVNQSFILKLFYDKLKYQGQLSKPDFVYIYDKDFMESRPTNLPSLYLKTGSREVIKLASSLKPGTINGLIIRSTSLEEASELLKTARSHPSLANIDLQAEVDVETREDVNRLKALGYSNVQISGSFFFKKVNRAYFRDHTCSKESKERAISIFSRFLIKLY
jgi:hypothetical protein